MELVEKVSQSDLGASSGDEFLERLKLLRVTSKDDIKANEYLLRIENTNKFSKGNISGWIGRAKSKKTFALTMFVAAILGGLRLFGKFNANKKTKVLWIDTEQSPADVQKVTKRLALLSGSEENLFMYGLRPFNPSERIKSIELLLSIHKEVEVLVIDGVRDLLMDINNAVESTEVIGHLMRWSYEKDIHIATVLHQNKADGNSRGHVGTELENKAETIIRITKDETDGSISWIEEIYGRGRGFEKFSFSIDDKGLPEIVQPVIDYLDDEKCPY
ncbi:AAA domain-containing protein [Tenacibaculum sp. 190524A02b]|uniref:AAA domain-containing protein n=1 Tax=Tenacibaculum vairaonense TaxID=3137860 RepID=A0ABM9PLU8_9FLAO